MDNEGGENQQIQNQDTHPVKKSVPAVLLAAIIIVVISVVTVTLLLNMETVKLGDTTNVTNSPTFDPYSVTGVIETVDNSSESLALLNERTREIHRVTFKHDGVVLFEGNPISFDDVNAGMRINAMSTTRLTDSTRSFETFRITIISEDDRLPAVGVDID
jgi:hypothetical protein